MDQSIFVSAQDYATAADVRKAYPDAYRVRKVEGGWMVFANSVDHDTWHAQK